MASLDRSSASDSADVATALESQPASSGQSNSRIQHFQAAAPPVYRRRFSDVANSPHLNQATLAGVVENPPSDRQRKSLDGALVTERKPNEEVEVLPDVVVEAMRLRSMRARSNSTVADTAADTKGKRYAEMMERFQIRRVSRQLSMSAGGNPVISARDHATEHAASMASLHDPMPTQSSASTQIPPLPSLAGRLHRAYTDTQGTSARDHSVMTPHGSTEGTLAYGRTGRFSVYWWLVGWKRRLVRDLEYLRDNLHRPITPSSSFSRVRLLVMMLVFTVHVVVFPLETAFLPQHTGIRGSVEYIEVVIEIVLLIDFALMFNTSFYNKRNVLVYSRKAIAKHYLRSWFLLDLASSVPVDIIIMAANDNSIQTRWIHLAYDVAVRSQRVVHLIRVARYMWTLLLDSPERSMFEWMLYSRYSHLFRIAWIILFIILIAHYLACGWKLLALTSISQTAAVAGPLKSPLEEYVANFYDVLQLLQGQGVPTTTVGQNIYATIAILMGSIALAIIFGHVAILVSNFNANSTNYQRKMESVFAIMSKLQLPAPLRERIHQYYEHLWREYESLDGEIVSFSKGLSHTLELEVVLFKYMDLIMHVPFWRNGSPDFQKQLMLHLSVRVYLPDDFIIRRGEVGEEFFMINRGVCELVLGPDSFECTTDPLPEDEDSSYSEMENNAEDGSPLKTARFDAATARYAEPDDEPVKVRRGRRGSRANLYKPGGENARVVAEGSSKFTHKLRRGQSFGELALFMNYERTANVRAITYVEMCVLQRQDFQKILVKHPTDRKHVLTAMLTKTMENNEATKVWCPLKAMVHSVFSEDETHKPENLSAMHAALLISSAVNLPLDDESIKFGVGERLREQLVDLRDKQRQGGSPKRGKDKAAPVTRPVEDVATSSQEAGERSSRPEMVQSLVDVQRLSEHVQQLEHVQTHMAMTLMDMSREVHTLRVTNERLQELVASYDARLGELLKMQPISRAAPPPQANNANSRSHRPSQEAGTIAPKVLLRPALHRQRSASMSSIHTSRGEVTARQPPLPSTTEAMPEPAKEEVPQAKQIALLANRRASFAAGRSLTSSNLHASSTPGKVKPARSTNVLHLRPIEGAARSAFNSVKSLLVESAPPISSPTKYADQLFDTKATHPKK